MDIPCTELKLLLIQMRSDQSMDHEFECVVKYSELDRDQLVSHDLLREDIDLSTLDEYDGIFIGGANEFRVSQGEPERLGQLIDVVRYCAEKDIPVLGLCFGAHIIAQAMGGEVAFRPENKEVSTVDIIIEDAARLDALMYDIPDTFKANCGRTDDIVALPDNAIVLGRSDKVRYHAFRIAGTCIYGTQFHAELGKQDEWERMDFAMAFSGYFADEEDLQHQKETVEETPEATILLKKFIDRIVLSQVRVSPSRGDTRLLLLQFRDDPVIKQKEYDSFVRYLGLTPRQVISHDALKAPVTNDMLTAVDGLVVAGNGSESSNDSSSYKDSILAMLRYTLENAIPTFAVCYGAQFAALEFGGSVERVEEMRETGTYAMYLTDEASDDPIFKEMHTPFNGQMGHNDSITQLPEGAIRLAYSDRVPNQAFRFPDKPFYAVQFHPELDADEIRFRFRYYKDYYADNIEEFNAIIGNIRESTDASKLLRLFVERIVVELHTVDSPQTNGVKCDCVESVHSTVCAVAQ